MEEVPQISICIPTYQGGRWIRETLATALAQDHRSFEVVVSDDASTDDTTGIVASFGDPRVRLLRSPERSGLAGNWNRCVAAARGRYIKPLMQDDLLDTDCIASMGSILDRHPSVGMVFSARRVLVDDAVDRELAAAWLRRFESLHGPLEPLAEVNEGRELVQRALRARFDGNPFGEPSAVMLRRTALEQVGLFNVRMRQVIDLEMWLRVAGVSDVGFIRRPLATFRVHATSTSSLNAGSGRAWMDRVWMLEGLREDPSVSSSIGPLPSKRIWLAVLASALRRAARALIARQPTVVRRDLRDLVSYLGWSRGGRSPRLHPRLDPVSPPDRTTRPR